MRDDLIRHAREIVSLCHATQASLRPFGDHYRAVDAFAEAARMLGGAITGGQVTFISPLHSSSPYTGDEPLEIGCERRARELDEDVADAIALYAGDTEAVVRALMILTRFLEDELDQQDLTNQNPQAVRSR